MPKANGQDSESRLDAIVLQFIEARTRGEAPDIDEFVKQYPGLEQDIRKRIASFGLVDSLFDLVKQTDGSDFRTQDTGSSRIGEQIGGFKITEVIGHGGMGIVYKAQDTRLDRFVAVKTMPTHLLEDETAQARFRREAKLLAALNHPHIAAIHDVVEVADGICHLILEYVPGQTLGEHMANKPLEINEALIIAQQLAEALAAAYERGVIHRDLKPGNIKITPDENVKILDFGIAKAFGPSGETQETAVTQAGRLVGTPAYMSPEQTRDKNVDHRSDIWSFGCVLYEMLTGHLAFEGETISDTIALVLQREPDWSQLPQDLPHNIRVLLRRCLEKDPKLRLQHIGDAVVEIRETLDLPAIAPPAAATLQGPPKSGQWRLSIVTGVICLAIGGVLSGIALRMVGVPKPPPAQPIWRTVVHPKTSLAFEALWHGALAISPDGTCLAYVEEGTDRRRRIYVREMDEFEAKPLPGTDGAVGPFFSPDGQWIGYADSFRKKLKKVPVEGGSPVILCDAENFGGGSWGADDSIVFTPNWAGGLWRISASADGLEQLTYSDPNHGEMGHCWPHLLPGEEAVLFTNRNKWDLNEYQLEVLTLDTGRRHVLLKGGTCPRYVAVTRQLVYARRTSLFTAGFDLDRLEVTGPHRSIMPVHTIAARAPAHYAVANNGSLVYVPAVTQQTELQPVWVDATGQAEALPLNPGDYHSMRMSPDGTRVVFDVRDGDNSDIWLLDVTHGTAIPLTSDGHSNNPVWTADSKRIVFVSQGKLFCQAAKSGTQAQQLAELKNATYPACCSPDGKKVLVRTGGLGTDVWVFPLENTQETRPVPFIERDNHQRNAVWSPDGTLVAYCSDELGSWEVYVEPYPGPGPKVRVSAEGGSQPVWSPNGKELYYRRDGKVIAVIVETEPEFKTGESRELFEGNYVGCRICQSYDVAPDGRFLMIRDPQEPAVLQINVVLNWFEELKRLVPGDGKQ